MSLEKQIIIDQITVVEDGTVWVREATKIIENGIELSKQYHRTSFSPDSDVSTQPQNIQDICKIAWTPEVVATYKAQIEANTLLNGVAQ